LARDGFAFLALYFSLLDIILVSNVAAFFSHLSRALPCAPLQAVLPPASVHAGIF
jgi:hypothetical protein